MHILSPYKCCGTSLSPKPVLRDTVLDVIHYSYRMSYLQEQIDTITSNIGKHRSSESASHLMDLIRMSKDESELFYTYVQKAAADVFERINMYATGLPKSYVYDDTKKTPIPWSPKREVTMSLPQKVREFLWDPSDSTTHTEYSPDGSINKFVMIAAFTKLDGAEYNRPWEWLSFYADDSDTPLTPSIDVQRETQTEAVVKLEIDTPPCHEVHMAYESHIGVVALESECTITYDDNTILELAPGADGRSVDLVGGTFVCEGVDVDYQSLNLKIKVRLDTKIATKSGAVVPIHKDVLVIIPCANVVCSDSDEHKFQVLPCNIPIKNLREAMGVADAEMITGVSVKEVLPAETEYLIPRTFHAGDILEYSGKLYEVLDMCNENSISLDSSFIHEIQSAEDYTECVHYFLLKPKELDETMISILDSAISDALVSSIIFHWLEVSYPSETAVYANKCADAIEAMRYRLLPFTPSVCSRKPRWL